MNNFAHIDLNDYTQILEPYKNGRIKGLYECPSCTGKLSVNKTDGTKFDCYDCGDRSAIRKALKALSGEDVKSAALCKEEKKALWEQKRLEQAQKKEADRLKLLPSVRRHELVLKTIAANPIKASHRKYLIEERKFTDAMISKYHGYNTWAGWTFPAVGYDGMFIESQHKSNGAYRWIAAGETYRRETGQNPLTFHGNRLNPTQIVLVEGLMIKPILTSERYPGCLVIGASGGQFEASSLEFLSAVRKHPGVPIIFMADGGSVRDKGVMGRIRSTHSILKEIDREMLIGEWGQYEKGGTDIDEIDPSTPIDLITLEQLYIIQRAVVQVDQRIWSGTSVSAKRKSLEANYLADQPEDLDTNVYLYRNSAELKGVYEDIMGNFIQFALDRSGCGSGKSSKLGGMENPEGITQLLYPHNQHRNTTTPEVARSFADAPSRHNGLFINPDKTNALGEPWLQTSQPAGANWEKTEGNCHLADEQRQWQMSGFANPEDKNPICMTCVHKDECRLSSGDGYGYIHELGVASMNARVTLAPQAMVPANKGNYDSKMAALDDQVISSFKSLTVTKTDILTTFGKLQYIAPDLAEELELVIVPILNAFETTEPHGCHHNDIFGELELPNAESLLHQTMAILQPNPLSLIHKGNDTSSALEKAGWKSTKVKPQLKDLISNWLGWILEGFANKVRVAVSVKGDKLTVKMADNGMIDILKKCKLTVIMSATESLEEIAQRFNIDIKEIAVISQPRGRFDNTTAHLLVGMGSYGKQRVDSANTRINELATSLTEMHGNCVVFDHIKSLTDRALWHRDTEGSNRYKHYKAILAIGKPTPNLGAMADEYYFLTGVRVSPKDRKDPEFKAFIRRRVAAATIQAFGRLRAQHRLDEDLHYYIACDREDFPISELMAAYPGTKLVIESVEDICLSAARPTVRTKIAIAKAIETNPKITMPELAEITGKAANTIKDYFRNYGIGYKKGRYLLYSAFIGKASLLDSDYANWENLLSQEYVDEHNGLLASQIDENSKASEMAARFEALNNPQIRALFAAIGTEATNHTIELLVLNLYLQVPNMKLSKNGESIEEIVEGLRSIAQRADMDGLELLRAAHADDKEALQYAASVVKKECEGEFEILKDLTIMANKVNALRLAREAV